MASFLGYHKKAYAYAIFFSLLESGYCCSERVVLSKEVLLKIVDTLIAGVSMQSALKKLLFALKAIVARHELTEF